jgi:hypothetical protein
MGRRSTVNFGVELLVLAEAPDEEREWAITCTTLPEIDEDGTANYKNCVRKTLWRCPNSHNLPLPPPQDAWIPVHELAIVVSQR